MFQSNKKIILAMTPDMKFFQCFENNLKFLGFDVILICNYKKSKYRNLLERLQNTFRKIVLKDKKFKENLFKKNEINNNLQTLNKIDTNSSYSLIVRADVFDVKVLKKIISKSNKNYCYHWDGLARHPEVLDFIDLFDKFYIFDKLDLITNKTYPTTNFYFDCYSDLFKNKIESDYDVYFLGTCDGRIERLITICEFLKAKKLRLKILLTGQPFDWLNKYEYLTFLTEPLTYHQNLEMISKCTYLIDVHHLHIHKGLSFRPFEALGYDKKLITTNDFIAKYDFYDENNIFIFNELDEKFNNFINSTTISIVDPKIKQKYSFTNWIKYVLNIDEFQSINIP